MEDRKGLPTTEKVAATNETNGRSRSRTPEDIWGEGEDFLEPDTVSPRYNETDSAVKRRKVEPPSAPAEIGQSDTAPEPAKCSAPAKANNGPFIDESDSEDDMEAYRDLKETTTTEHEVQHSNNYTTHDPPAEHEQSPSVRDATSYTENDDLANFDDVDEDELVGEEFREELWRNADEEQRNEFELDAGDDFYDPNFYDEQTDEGLSTCPICQKALKGLGETVCPQIDLT